MRKHKKKKNKLWYSPVVLLFLFGLLILFSYKTLDLFKRYQNAKVIRGVVENEVNDLNKRIEGLNQEIHDLGTEEGKEGIIRIKYQVAKEGEKVLNIIEEEPEDLEKEEPEKNKSFLDKMKSFFIN